tara:strand:- start:6919 stop:7104 length:186 start_codon:yes stop_codon:yes gene_type:complete
MNNDITIKEVLSSEDWTISNLSYNKESDSHNFISTHIDGRIIYMNRSEKQVSQAIKEQENE